MFKKFALIAITAASLITGVTAAAVAADIAAVDVRYVVAESGEMKRAYAEVETMKTAMEKELGEMEKELESASESLKRKRTVMSQEQVMEEETALKGRLREYRLKGENMNEQLNNEVTLRRKRVIKALQEVVNEIAQKEDYAVVLDSSTLLYAGKGVDITEKVLTSLNDHFENN